MKEKNKNQNKNSEEIEEKIAKDLLQRIENNELSFFSDELEKNITEEIEKENYIPKDWHQYYAKKRIKEKIRKRIEEKTSDNKSKTFNVIDWIILIFCMLAIPGLILDFISDFFIRANIEDSLVTGFLLFLLVWGLIVKLTKFKETKSLKSYRKVIIATCIVAIVILGPILLSIFSVKDQHREEQQQIKKEFINECMEGVTIKAEKETLYYDVCECMYEWIIKNSDESDVIINALSFGDDMPQELLVGFIECSKLISLDLIDMESLENKKLSPVEMSLLKQGFIYECMGEQEEFRDYCECMYEGLIESHELIEIIEISEQEELPMEWVRIIEKCSSHIK